MQLVSLNRALRRFSSVKNFFGFTLRALTKRSSRAVLYVDAGDLKSTLSSRSLTSTCKISNRQQLKFDTQLFAGKACAQSEGNITPTPARRRAIRGIAANSLTQRN